MPCLCSAQRSSFQMCTFIVGGPPQRVGARRRVETPRDSGGLSVRSHTAPRLAAACGSAVAPVLPDEALPSSGLARCAAAAQPHMTASAGGSAGASHLRSVEARPAGR